MRLAAAQDDIEHDLEIIRPWISVITGLLQPTITAQFERRSTPISTHFGLVWPVFLHRRAQSSSVARHRRLLHRYHLASWAGPMSWSSARSSPAARPPGMRRAWWGNCASANIAASEILRSNSITRWKRADLPPAEMNGGLRLATTEERMTEISAGDDRAFAWPGDEPAVAQRGAGYLWPLMDVSDLVGQPSCRPTARPIPADITRSRWLKEQTAA